MIKSNDNEVLLVPQSIPAWEELMTPLSKRPVDELPWLQLAAGDLDGLSNTLLNIFTLQRMQQYVILFYLD